ncbi:hypothetical protein GCM10012279_39150 [Micromonospora yangpuensis]|nr:hypothetical protein GCM10012279_39150 [Micromonospora yangpuensis]
MLLRPGQDAATASDQTEQEHRQRQRPLENAERDQDVRQGRQAGGGTLGERSPQRGVHGRRVRDETGRRRRLRRGGDPDRHRGEQHDPGTARRVPMGTSAGDQPTSTTVLTRGFRTAPGTLGSNQEDQW